MATVVSQHLRHLGRHFGFEKNTLSKLQQILLKLAEDMCLQPQKGI